jgi:hypothetical protein
LRVFAIDEQLTETVVKIKRKERGRRYLNPRQYKEKLNNIDLEIGDIKFTFK